MRSDIPRIVELFDPGLSISGLAGTARRCDSGFVDFLATTAVY